MSKRIVVAIVCVVLVCMSISSFAGEAVIIQPSLVGYPTYFTSEWKGTTAGSAPIVQGGRYPQPAHNGTKYAESYAACSVLDQDFDGHMGVNAGTLSCWWAYSYGSGILAGTAGASGGSGVKGEGRTALRYDLSNTFSRMVWFDQDYFHPSAAPATDGWSAYNVLVPGGSSKHLSLVQYIVDPDYLAANPTIPLPLKNAFTFPRHFDLNNTTVALPINLNLSVEKVLWCIINRKATGSTGLNPVDQPNRWWEIYHTQPPIDHYTLTTFDTVFGNHSDGRSYVDRIVLRAPFTTAYHNQYGTVYQPYNTGITCLPNNFPTASPDVVSGFILIDEPGTTNDRFMYHGDGDSDPLINSIVADMRDGRNHVVMNFRAYRYYEDNWPTTSKYFNYLHFDEPGCYAMAIWFGDVASAEDWVLYN